MIRQLYDRMINYPSNGVYLNLYGIRIFIYHIYLKYEAQNRHANGK